MKIVVSGYRYAKTDLKIAFTMHECSYNNIFAITNVKNQNMLIVPEIGRN